ncbi:MAG: hypothetical protein KME29_07285 [Calothrix sp. FI2-JRJ7]|nr:hypothetical protein [Calothrix sp. FI2-JRJ7]
MTATQGSENVFEDLGFGAVTEPQPDQAKTELDSLLQPLYESGLLTPPSTTSDAPPVSEADLVAMVQSIKVTGQPLSETIIEDRGEW